MKIFKRVYFCALTVLLAITIIAGFAVPNTAGARIDNAARDNAALFAQRIQAVASTAISPNTSMDDSQAVRRELWDMLTMPNPSDTPVINIGQATSTVDRHHREVLLDNDGNPRLDQHGRPLLGDIIFTYNEFTVFYPTASAIRGGTAPTINNSWHNPTPTNVGGHNMALAQTSIIGFGNHEVLAGRPQVNLPMGNPNFRYTVGPETLNRFADDDNMQIIVDREIFNIVVIVPGNTTRSGGAADAILLTTSMDVPRSGGGGAAAARIGAFVNEIAILHQYQMDNGRSKYDHDIIFLFTDARHDSNLGAKVFIDSFVGFRGFERELASSAINNGVFYQSTQADNTSWSLRLVDGQPVKIPNIVERIVLAVNFDNIGTGSAPILLNTSGDNAQLVSAFSSITGSVSSPLINSIYDGFRSDFDAFSNIAHHNRSDLWRGQAFDGFDSLAAMNIITYGNAHHHNTVFDVFDRTDNSSLRQIAVVSNMVNGIMQEFGNIEGTQRLDGQREVYHFSVLAMFSIRHGIAGPIVLAILMILLLAGTILVNIKRKAFSFSLVGKGIAVQLLVMLTTIAALFVLYFLIGIILAGFGAFTIQHMITMVYSNAGILIGFAFAALAIMSLAYILIKRFFELKATDVVRGGAVIFGILAIILSFAMPGLGVMIGIPALLVLANLFLCTLFKQRFMDRFGFDIERLFLYLVPMIFFIAFFLPSIIVISSVSLTILTPILIIPFIFMFSFIVPYASMLRGIFDRVLGRLPKRTIIVKKYGTERVEDKAKPGKFTEVTGERKVKEKVKWKYKHGVGTAVVAVIAAIVIMISAGFGSSFASNTGQGSLIANASDFNQNIYANSMLLVQDSHGLSLRIHDTTTFRRARRWLSGFSWDTAINAYTKDNLGIVRLEEPRVEAVTRGMVITAGNIGGGFGRGMTVVHIEGTGHITGVRVYQDRDTDGEGLGDPFVFENRNLSSSMTIRLPMNEQGAFIYFEFIDPDRPGGSVSVDITQYLWDRPGNEQLRGLLAQAQGEESNDVNLINSGVRRLDEYMVHGSVRFGVVVRVEGRAVSW